MRSNRNTVDARREVTKRATLGLVWGIIAGVAYFGLIGNGINAVAQASGLINKGQADSGLLSLKNVSGDIALPQSFQPFLTAALFALPFAIIGTILFSILVRARPRQAAFGGLLVAAAIVGLLGSLVFFIRVVATRGNGKAAVLALVTGVVVSILLRLQRSIRQSYRQNPAVVSLVVALLAVIYLVLSNGTNITSIILADVDVWLALVGFAIALVAGVGILRYRRLIVRGK